MSIDQWTIMNCIAVCGTKYQSLQGAIALLYVEPSTRVCIRLDAGFEPTISHYCRTRSNSSISPDAKEPVIIFLNTVWGWRYFGAAKVNT